MRTIVVCLGAIKTRYHAIPEPQIVEIPTPTGEERHLTWSKADLWKVFMSIAHTLYEMHTSNSPALQEAAKGKGVG